MLSLMEVALRLNARFVTLEVRVSNAVARKLYEKLGFRQAGIRPRYYTDNNEDAVVMWSDEVRAPPFQRLAERQQALAGRLYLDQQRLASPSAMSRGLLGIETSDVDGRRGGWEDGRLAS